MKALAELIKIALLAELLIIVENLSLTSPDLTSQPPTATETLTFPAAFVTSCFKRSPSAVFVKDILLSSPMVAKA